MYTYKWRRASHTHKTLEYTDLEQQVMLMALCCLYMWRFMQKESSDICGQGSPTYSCTSAQSDMRATPSSDKSLWSYFTLWTQTTRNYLVIEGMTDYCMVKHLTQDDWKGGSQPCPVINIITRWMCRLIWSYTVHMSVYSDQFCHILYTDSVAPNQPAHLPYLARELQYPGKSM